MRKMDCWEKQLRFFFFPSRTNLSYLFLCCLSTEFKKEKIIETTENSLPQYRKGMMWGEKYREQGLEEQRGSKASWVARTWLQVYIGGIFYTFPGSQERLWDSCFSIYLPLSYSLFLPTASSLLLFSLSVVSCSLWPHGLQRARLPWPSPYPGVCSSSCPLSQ